MQRFVLLAVGLSASTAAWAGDSGPPTTTATSNLAASLDEPEARPPEPTPAPLEQGAVTSDSNPIKIDEAATVDATASQADSSNDADGVMSGSVLEPVRSRRAVRLNRPGPGVQRDQALPWYRGAVISLAVVLAVIAGLALLLRRLLPSFRPGSGGLVEVVGRSHLSPKQSLNLVRVGRRLVLVGATPERMSALCEIDDPREVMEILARVPSSSGLGGGRFEEVLTEAGREFDEPDEAPGEVGKMPSAARLDEAKGRVQGLLARLKTMQRQVDP